MENKKTLVSNSFIAYLDVVFCIVFSFIFIFFKGLSLPLLVLLCLCLNYNLRCYITSVISSICFGFLISNNLGFEIILLNSSLFIIKASSNLIIKNLFFKRRVIYIISGLLLILYIYYLKPTSQLLINLSINYVIYGFLFFSLENFIDSVTISNYSLNSKDRILLFTIIPFIFEPISAFYLAIIRLWHLLLLKSSKFSETFSSVTILCFILIFYQNYSQIDILTILIPFVFANFILKSYPLFSYLIFYILSNVFFNNDFIYNETFYQGFIPIILAFMINDNVYQKIHMFLYKEEYNVDNKIEKSSENVLDILDYINVLLDSSIEDSQMMIEKAMSQFNGDLCFNCPKKFECSLDDIKKKGIEEKLNKQEKEIIFEKCIFPYKFIKRTYMISSVYKKEFERLQNESLTHQMYKKDLKTILKPLQAKQLEKDEEINLIKENLKKNSIDFSDVFIKNDEINVILKQENENLTSLINDCIEEVTHRSFYLKNHQYKFPLGGFEYKYEFKNQFKTDIEIYSKGISEPNGDSYLFQNINSKFVLLLSDGMGHDSESSYNLSSYLVKALMAYIKLEEKFQAQIESINRMIYSKSILEMYATLDYFVLDLVNLNFTLFKAGSFPTYIYHNNTVTESRKNFPPLGILKEIEPFAYKDSLCENDIIVLLTDGFKDDVKEIITNCLMSYHNESAKNILKYIYDEFKKTNLNNDDQTLIVIKIEKNI